MILLQFFADLGVDFPNILNILEDVSKAEEIARQTAADIKSTNENTSTINNASFIKCSKSDASRLLHDYQW